MWTDGSTSLLLQPSLCLTCCSFLQGFPGGSGVKNLPAMQDIWVWSLGWEDPLEKGMATYSSILAWETPWTEEPGTLHSPSGHKESDTTKRLTLHFFMSKELCSPLPLLGNYTVQKHKWAFNPKFNSRCAVSSISWSLWIYHMAGVSEEGGPLGRSRKPPSRSKWEGGTIP